MRQRFVLADPLQQEAASAAPDALEQCHLAIVAGAWASRQFTLEKLLQPNKGWAADSHRSPLWVDEDTIKFIPEFFKARPRTQSLTEMPPAVPSASGGSPSRSSQVALKQRLLALAEASAESNRADIRALIECLKQEADPMGDILQRVVQ